MRDATPAAIHLKDYRRPDYLVDTVELRVELGEESTTVHSHLAVRRRTGVPRTTPLVLDGQELELLSVAVDGQVLEPGVYRQEAESLVLDNLPARFSLEIETRIHPEKNTQLEGLYKSGGMFCTQCEAEGFRRITFFPDRPDVMARYTTTLVAEHERYPVLLANGDRVDAGRLDDGRHWARWVDPHPKPSYLFAMVAGDLAVDRARHVTPSGREVALELYVEPHNTGKTAHALASLQQAMAWDETTFGLEYDLDTYMIVAVDDFNMGAMENKGLNIFNTACVLARPDTATDADYDRIQSIVGHEYFHNWTGNRVTCRDWFQLSLKEGLTVFRDQEFSADMFSRAIQRIGDVRVLRNHQFSEDAGPMAHPVRPAFYQEINNFYTATVYNKGAEVVRMMHCLLGAEKFRAGMDLYFARHDGQAVTTDDFRQAMQDASGIDLDRFQRWYEQAGTPRIDISRSYDADTRSLTLDIRQHAGTTRGELNRPFHMPMRLALFASDGEPLPLDDSGRLEWTVDIRDHHTRLEFDAVAERSLPSAFRGFSAPVIVDTDLDDAELAVLMVCDSDEFNRWEASQQLATRIMLKMLKRDGSEWGGLQQPLLDAFASLLADRGLDRALTAEMLVLPGEKYLAEMLEQADVHAIRRVREALAGALAAHCEDSLLRHYRACDSAQEYTIEAPDIARRRLKNTCLSHLLRLQREEYFALCGEQFDRADNMTDQIACLRSAVHYRHSERERIVASFYQQWQDTPLVVDKWFGALGASRAPQALDEIAALFEHPAYSLRNPNRARSLLGAMMANTAVFHQADGRGYAIAADRILALDRINPQVAARLANPFVHWRRLLPELGRQMKAQVESMLAAGELSNDLDELLTTSLED